MDSIDDLKRLILMASFAFELKIERSLFVAANTLDKRDLRRVSALEDSTPRYYNMSPSSTGTPFAQRTYLMEACQRYVALVLSWLIVRPISLAQQSIRRRQLIWPENRHRQQCKSAYMYSQLPNAILCADK